MIRRSNYLLLLMSMLLMSTCTELKQATGTLIWSEEFDQAGLPDTTNWSYDVGNTCERPMGCGWGNNELQFYTDAVAKNARVENGHLIIEAHRERIASNEYSSARLISKSKANFKYGWMEIKAKLPKGRGTWPAIWMMPEADTYGGWPRSGEIDIMEHVGYDPGVIHGTPHTQAYHWSIGTQKGGRVNVSTSQDSFHIYSIDWQEGFIDWYVDGKRYHRFEREDGTEAWPFDQHFYFILNIAVGGHWGGAKGVDTTIWPQKMYIDYVRVYGS